MLALIAPKYFAGDESVLHNACLEISKWPSLQAGECIQLPLLGTLFQTYIPSLTSANLQQPHTSTANNQNNQIEVTNATTILNQVKLDTNSTSNAYVDQLSVKNDNRTLNNDGSIYRSIDERNCNVILSREDILDSYKQSKEMLLSQKLNKQPDSSCDSNSSKSIGANNANNVYEIENCGGGDDANVDLDVYFDDEIDNESTTTNTQPINNCESSTSQIEKPLSFAQSISKTPIVLQSVTEIDIFRSLYAVLSYTHLLWELVLTAEPIVIMATSPSDCSHMVQSLMR